VCPYLADGAPQGLTESGQFLLREPLALGIPDSDLNASKAARPVVPQYVQHRRYCSGGQETLLLVGIHEAAHHSMSIVELWSRG
jgi:hypothetical protein